MTLDEIYARCVEVGDCLEWAGRFGGRGKRDPRVWNRRRNTHTSVRREVVEASSGKPLSAALRCGPRCKNPRCVKLEHIQIRTARQVLAGCRPSAAGMARITNGCRARSTTKLTLAVVREIRASDLSCRKEAVLRGVSPSLIAMVRRHEVWREEVSGASVFTALLRQAA